MKLYLKIILAVFIIGICAVFTGYYYNFNAIKIKLVGNSSSENQKALHYHFVVISQDTGDDFWQSFESGAEEAGSKYDAAIEFNGPVINNDSEEMEDLNIAIASRVDGIAINSADESQFTPLIEKAINEGISVVTVESDDKLSKRSTFIGPNTFNAGISAGNLVVDALHIKSNVGLIFGGNYTDNSDAETSFLSGFGSSIKNYPAIKLETVQTSNAGYFGAEEIIREMLNSHPDINTVVSTNTDDTLEIVQVLIDLNKVGKITVIGYNYSSQIHDYIENGVIYGTVVENPNQTGYQSIEALVKSVKGQKVPDFIDTGIETVTRSNLLKIPYNF
jgi:ribose transport system substrate-binding protein